MYYKYGCNTCDDITILDEEDEHQWAKICEHCMWEDLDFIGCWETLEDVENC